MEHTTAATSVDYGALKTLVPLAVPVIKTAVENWFSPALAQLLKHKEIAKNAEHDQVTKAFEEYLLRTYARLSFMNTIVFGNQQKRIQDLYIPLTVNSSRQDGKQFTIDGWHNDFVPVFKRIVITDTAGMGKSTILKWLFISSFGIGKTIPIFIELRTLSTEKPILERIHEELCPIDKPFDKDFLLHLLKSGAFVFFLDGFDEVPFEEQSEVTKDVQSFIQKAFNNLFVLASRHESALGSFGEFQEFTIKPLSKQEAYLLLRRYDETQEHAEALIADLEGSKYQQLKELLTNPMLVSLLFKAYSYKPKIPFKKQIFYRQVFDALFDMHDSTKGGAFIRKKHSGLDIDEFHTVMRDLGFATAKLGKIEYSKDEISDTIKHVRERNGGILFQPSALLKDLVTTVPLFNKEGEHYKWAHKSVQDYFASQFIAFDAKGNQKALLDRIYDGGHSRRFENILDFLHDTDNACFRRLLLSRMLQDYVVYYESSYTNEFPGVSKKAIEERKQLTFGHGLALANLKNKAFKDLFYLEDENPFEKLFGDLISSKGTSQIELNLFIDSADNSQHVLRAFAPKPASGILQLLARRKYPYVKKVRSGRSLGLDLPPDIPVLVDDDPSSPLNTPRNFEAVNSMLKSHGFAIMIDQVRRTLKSITDECQKSKIVDQILQDL